MLVADTCCKCGCRFFFVKSESDDWMRGKRKCRSCLDDERGKPPFYSPAEKAAALASMNALYGEEVQTWDQMKEQNRRTYA